MSAVTREESDGFWAGLRVHTQARIGLGHAGDALPTRQVLEFRGAHALARDAVHTPLDVGTLLDSLAETGLGEPVHVTSRAATREEYVRRPDLGRLPGPLDALRPAHADLGIVVMDGLSSRALADHGAALVRALREEIGDRYTVAPPVLVTQGRVALGDHIGAALGVRTLLVIIGERPGLSVADSLGIYLTHQPRPGLADSARNCISNIHPPDGLSYQAAAQTAIRLVTGAWELGESGVRLKDTGPALGAAPQGEIAAAG
ncbi:MAG: ethanolamine ammonia-lyase subunit EutC [Propioniciclava sp.]|uniref:ethanolamine ammonia-lyase subunit EutC n=1 Tax=Propioniciclava sp. TaxID=2038686 RepID=UPI0039E5F79C